MILTNYTSLAGQPPTVMFTDGNLIHAVQVTLENLHAALGLWPASTADSFEVVLDSRARSLDAETMECPRGPCDFCLHRGWLPVDYTDTLMVFTCSTEGVEVTAIDYGLDDHGEIVLREPKPTEPGVGAIPMLVEAVAAMPKKPNAMRVGDLLRLWEPMGYGEVLR